MRWVGGIVLVLLVAGVGTAQAQYFGQSKVEYKRYSFQVIQTEHFDVYFYEEERTAALDAARMAERSYGRLSRVLRRDFLARKPIILYASTEDFQETNAIPGDLGEGTGGVTEPVKHRMVVPFTGSYAELAHVLQHEMTHQFQFDVISHGQIGGGLSTLESINPPLWFMEGMAEYLSLGPIDPYTSMWLRDAALEGHLPSIEQMTFDPRIFPYYFGHAIWAYIGARWGDEVIGEILKSTVRFGVETSFQRVLGRSTTQISEDWREAVQTTVLPHVAEHLPARNVAKAVLTEERSGGRWHLGPVFSPDGKQLAYLSEGNGFFVDLYIADAQSGRNPRRLIKSTVNSHYESLRWINSAGEFSPDGNYFVLAVQEHQHDDLVILDLKEGREVGRLHPPVDEITSPTWSPDGKRIAFTGYLGGWSDLYIVNRDGTGFERLTDDRYADLQPAWSPDGKTIAFSTDRGPNADLATLRFGNMRVALYHLDTKQIELLPHMGYGTNINPVWSPDGQSLAFVSDRTGIANVFLFDFADSNAYQLTDVWTGIDGITPLSPCITWARNADRLAFTYYRNEAFDVYTVDDPRSLRRQPYPDSIPRPVFSLLTPTRRDSAAQAAAGPAKPAGDEPRASASLYRSEAGFRPSGLGAGVDSVADTLGSVALQTMFDSPSLGLPDTSEFTIRPYRTRFSTDFVASPTIGYQRNALGAGIFGGTSISMSDMLGDRSLTFGGGLDGRLVESQVVAVYSNQGERTAWNFGFTQTPYFIYLLNAGLTSPTGIPPGSSVLFSSAVERLVLRDAFLNASYPFDRFTRLEFGLHLVDVGQAKFVQQEYYSQSSNTIGINDGVTIAQPDIAYVAPGVAWVHDNSLFGFVGPFMGARDRLEISPAIGGWQFEEGLIDLRRYLFLRPFTLAIRTLVQGRVGPNADEFPIYLGDPSFLRGYTAGSILNHECTSVPGTVVFGFIGSSNTGCPTLDQLIGSRIAVGNVELRFPLTQALSLGFLPPFPVEAAIFYDAGIAWQNGDQLVWSRAANQNPETVRQPLASWGGSVRMNLFGIVILRIDLADPLNRTYNTPYLTVDIGETF